MFGRFASLTLGAFCVGYTAVSVLIHLVLFVYQEPASIAQYKPVINAEDSPVSQAGVLPTDSVIDGGPIREVDVDTVPTLDELIPHIVPSGVQPGGLWHPPVGSKIGCGGNTRKSRVAILIPYRNRPDHLPIFLKYIHPFMQRQNLDYGVYVVEQDDDLAFNRAELFNVGFLEAQLDQPYSCYVFHDVDHVPSDDRNSYCCGDEPRHLSTNVDRWDYKLLYDQFLGGVTQFGDSHVYAMNGMSNAYWGWGGEDDDVLCRWRTIGMTFSRPPNSYGRYRTIGSHGHKSAPKNKDRFEILKMARSRMLIDGLNSVRYHLVNKDRHALYTHLKIRLGSQNVTTMMVEPPKRTLREIRDKTIPHWSCQ
ncbi:beta-1,4-galactosyltransferase 1-like [Sycon ciliatum]|uniref:beta-1,4-galactosyltransferase 1-like n=1 Tax=Sycon ciliatum TaxID=27933 RepID=UPI0020AE6E10|eukprot:scpid88782/ scgid32841/ Beta-1,4-galactosyltransferase 1; UDP-Gal:beta-GlcNAc beta-1,4-galactosyltransferase 1; UDP-galactose:beta-N-acetylglucosamine beta-1,4-galactosyltransferase 1; Lactose synthase A protein; N-acetyllactosamine synthase; Nal synthase; Beta-N-acetylglucosaminylglycopeptide beta-1,4-galactosyltransferase; Beta-N-acetylglucosaminyl-glycolipid beta-1,4-galactosyltransferase; Processed beta-1,4-galactosyltransferase 1